MATNRVPTFHVGTQCVNKQVKNSIIRTLCYSDVFDYPLTKEEIWRFLIGKKISRELFEKRLTEFPPSMWEFGNKLYCLSGRKEIVGKRINRQKDSREKINLARKIIKRLSLVPTILVIGISGALAVENSDAADDIDLFVIARTNTLWFTRLLLIFMLKVMGLYRGRKEKRSRKFCLNMLIDERALGFKINRQDLYTAHEIVQLKPMFERDSTYKKFLNANRWVGKFLPNALEGIKNKESRFKNKNSLFIIIEKLAKTLQLWYMRKHRTKEIIENHFLAFHPYEYKNYVLKEYNKRLKRYEI